MNTKYLIGGLVVAAVVVGAYIAMKPGAPAEQAMTEQMQNRMSMRHSLRDFISMPGESMKCAYAHTDAANGVTTEGTTYVAGGKVRSDSTITQGTNKTTSSSIIDGDTMYAWGSDMPQGMKMSLSAMTSMSNDAQQNQNMQGMGGHSQQYDQQYDYSCEPWSADQSFFAPPAGIQFTDYTEMMQNMGGMMKGMQGGAGMQGGTDAGMMDGEMMMDHSTMGGTGGMNGSAGSNAMMCAACEQAPDAESKAQCKVAFGCQ